MKNRFAVLPGLFALLAFVGIFYKTAYGFSGLVPLGPPVTGSGVAGNGSDGSITRWSSYYGQPAVVNSNWMVETSTGIGVNDPDPLATVDITSIGTSIVGLNVNAQSGTTANIAQFTINDSTAVVIGPQGHLMPRQYLKTQIDSLVPDGIGAQVEDINGSFPYNVCISTGLLASQWFAVVQSTGGTNGGGTHQSGCGSGN